MSDTRQHLINEAKRFYQENNRSPKVKEWDGKNGYPSYSLIRKQFGSWSKFLFAADLPMNIQHKERQIRCEICGKKFTTNRSNKKICDSKKCRYVRDSLLRVKYLKKKYPHSIFHHVTESKLKEYFACNYKLKKQNINLIQVV